MFIFLCTTDPQNLSIPLQSRCFHFHLDTFSDEQVKSFIKSIAIKESLSVSDTALGLIALNSAGHLRTALKQLELVIFQGESSYISNFSSILKLVKQLFTDFSIGDTELVTSLSSYNPLQVRQLVQSFMKDQIFNPSGEYHNLYKPLQHFKLLQSWCKLTGYIVDPSLLWSALYTYRPVLRALSGHVS
jgi:DNA polymerase III delta prime subunit